MQSGNKKILITAACFAVQMVSAYQFSTFDSYKTKEPLNLQTAAPAPPNCNEAYLGYNLIKGNPVNFQASGTLGFTATAIFAPEAGSETQGGYNVPESYTLSTEDSCDATPEVTYFNGMTSYAKWLSEIAEFNSGSAFGWGFGVAQQTQTYYKKFYPEHKTIRMESVHCSVYKMTTNPMQPPAPSPGFIEALEYLTDAEGSEIYYEFFNSVGTHYQSSTLFGAASFVATEIGDVQLAMTEGYKSNFGQLGNEVNAEVKQYYRSPNHSKKMSSEAAQRRMSASGAEAVTTVSNGPVFKDDVQTWHSDVEQMPVPIQFSLIPLYELIASPWLTDIYPIGTLNSTQLQSIAANMKKYAATYCDTYLKEQNSEQDPVVFCQEPQKDIAYGLGQQMAARPGSGEWGPMIAPPSSVESTWYLQCNSFENYCYGICVDTASEGKVCSPPESDKQPSSYAVNAQGPIVEVDLYLGTSQNGLPVEDMRLGYLDQDSNVVYSDWARWNGDDSMAQQQEESKTMQIVNYTVDNGYILGMAPRVTASGIIDMITYNGSLVQ